MAAGSVPKWKNYIIAAVTLAAILVCTGVLFDYYYEFNDDMLMKDILSGAYTGVPEALNIQMLSPLSAFLSVFYRISPAVPWYGLFLLACQYVSLILILVRALEMTDSFPGGIIMGIVAFLFCTALILPHIVFIQYTVTVAIMAACAGFLIGTAPPGLSFKEFVIRMILPVFIITVGFCLRSEMMLLCMPFLFLAAASLFHREYMHEKKGILPKYIAVAATVIVLLGLCFGIDKLSYASPEWKAFRTEFDSRTRLYDYQYVPDYKEAEDFYVSENISEAQVALLQNYDYGIDSRIDAPLMDRVSEYAKQARGETVSQRLADSVREYIWYITHLKGGVYSLLVLFLYVMALIAIIHNGLSKARWGDSSMHSPGRAQAAAGMRSSDKAGRIPGLVLLRVGGLFAMRSICWIYVIYGRRLPDRITHSLYIIEIVVLLGMVLTEYSGTLHERRYLKMVTAIIMILGGVILTPLSISSLKERVASQDKINRYSEAIESYCSAHPDSFYWEDVYSTIIDGETFNGKVFADASKGAKNYDLIGGWCMNSPLLKKKAAGFGIEDIAEDAAESSDTYIIIADIYDTDWITGYYADTGRNVSVTKTDEIGGYFGVYSVSYR